MLPVMQFLAKAVAGIRINNDNLSLKCSKINICRIKLNYCSRMAIDKII